jgi:hypothetical protein
MNLKKKRVPPRRLGDLAEICLLFKAEFLGFIGSRPWTVNAPFDLILWWPPTGRLSLIQVKSTACCVNDFYQVNLWTKHRRYTPENVDFIAAYIVPHDVWYIVPIRAVPPGTLSLSLAPTRRSTRCWTEAYREAWHLLK